MTYCCFRHFSNGTVLSRLCFYEIMPEKTLFKVWRGPPDVRLRKGTVNKSTGCLAAAAHRCIQHEISKWSAYYSLDCAKIQYIAFLCAVKITSPINKASQGIVRKKKKKRTCPVSSEPPSPNSIFSPQRPVTAYIVLCLLHVVILSTFHNGWTYFLGIQESADNESSRSLEFAPLMIMDFIMSLFQ